MNVLIITTSALTGYNGGGERKRPFVRLGVGPDGVGAVILKSAMDGRIIESMDEREDES